MEVPINKLIPEDSVLKLKKILNIKKLANLVRQLLILIVTILMLPFRLAKNEKKYPK